MMVRLKHLYALGYEKDSICAILQNEFQDIEVNYIDLALIRKIIERNKPMLEEYKVILAEQVQAEQVQAAKDLFRKAAVQENKMATRLLDKIDGLLDSLSSIDLTELDEDGRPKHLLTYYSILEAIDKTQKMAAKISGTDALREFQVFRMKAEMAASLKGNSGGLLPVPTGGGMPDLT